MLASGAAALLQIIVAPWPGSACGTADHGSARLRDPIYGRPMPTGFVPMGTRGAYRHDLAGVVSHIASLDRSDSLGNRCVVVACNFGAGNGLATPCHVVLRFAGGDRSRRRRLIALLLRPRWAGSGVVALALGTVPGVVVLVLGGLRLRGVLDIANGAAVVFLFVLAG
jgi:hypothetical protein